MVKEPKLVTNSNIKIKQVKVLKIERQNNDHAMFHSSPCKKENPKNSKLFFINGKSNSIQTDPIYPIFQHDMNMESRVWSKSQLSECNAYEYSSYLCVHCAHDHHHHHNVTKCL